MSSNSPRRGSFNPNQVQGTDGDCGRCKRCNGPCQSILDYAGRRVPTLQATGQDGTDDGEPVPDDQRLYGLTVGRRCRSAAVCLCSRPCEAAAHRSSPARNPVGEGARARGTHQRSPHISSGTPRRPSCHCKMHTRTGASNADGVPRVCGAPPARAQPQQQPINSRTRSVSPDTICAPTDRDAAHLPACRPHARSARLAPIVGHGLAVVVACPRGLAARPCLSPAVLLLRRAAPRLRPVVPHSARCPSFEQTPIRGTVCLTNRTGVLAGSCERQRP